jgi:hypothetical protein
VITQPSDHRRSATTRSASNGALKLPSAAV